MPSVQKAIFICMDGLGGCPEVTFRNLSESLEKLGHRVIVIDVSGIVSHEDRVKRVRKTFEFVKTDKAKDDKIFLVGQSAGAGAVRAAVKIIGFDPDLAGIIHLSGSVSRFIDYMTKQLFQGMFWRMPRLLLGKVINTTEAEYDRLVQPLPRDQAWRVLANRVPISGVEARKLAFWPDEFEILDYYPMLVIYGSKDQWVSPKGHRSFCKKFAKYKMLNVSPHEIEGVGHLTLSSHRREHVLEIINDWIKGVQAKSIHESV